MPLKINQALHRSEPAKDCGSLPPRCTGPGKQPANSHSQGVGSFDSSHLKPISAPQASYENDLECITEQNKQMGRFSSGITSPNLG